MAPEILCSKDNHVRYIYEIFVVIYLFTESGSLGLIIHRGAAAQPQIITSNIITLLVNYLKVLVQPCQA